MKKLVCLILSLVLALSMGCCAFAESGLTISDMRETLKAAGPELLNGEGVQIAFVISDLSNEIFVELMDACKTEAEKLGATFTFCEAQEVVDKITAIENYTSAGMDIILCHVADPDAMQPSIEEAQARGSKFIAYDTDTATSDMYFGAENFLLGYKIAENACRWINETFAPDETVKVGIGSYPDFAFLVTREEGIRAGFAELCPNAEIVVSQQAGFVPDGVEVGEVWVQAYPDLNCIVGINDSGIVGIYQAFEMGGIDVSAENTRLGFFGCDAVGEAMTLIDKGTVFRGTIALDLVGGADCFMMGAVILANGGTVEHDFIFDMVQVDVTNYEKYMNHEGL
jgi:ribose transport system substrate-binding protein